MERRDEILAAVLAILRSEGAAGLTTAAVAARAHCSKKTLYRLFGDKQGMLRALVEAQAGSVQGALAEASGGLPARTALENGLAALIDLLTGEASLAINRAAMAEPGGELATILLQSGRGDTLPIFEGLLRALQQAGELGQGEPRGMAARLIGLAMGERQVRALLGDADARPGKEEIGKLARGAVAALLQLEPPTRD